MYKLTRGSSVIRLADGTSIPKDPLNRDYQQYLEDVKNGAEVLAADPEPVRPPKIDTLDEVPADQDEKLAVSVDLLTGYLKLATPTNAQTLGALKLTIRLLLWLLKRQGL